MGRLLIGFFACLCCLQPSGANAADTMALPVPTVTLRAGEIIAREALEVRRFTVPARVASSYFQSPEGLVGRVARRTLRAGMAIPIRAVRDAYAVTEGQRVTIALQAAGLSVTSVGTALEPGAVGALVSVRNGDTGVVVRGTVESTGRVRIGGEGAR